MAGTARAVATPGGSWPPNADPDATELSTPVVLAILVAGYLGELLAFAVTSSHALPALSPFGSAADTVIRQLVVPSAMALGVSLGIVLLLGWHRASGLTVGRWSPWGGVPLLVLAVAAVATAGMPGVAARGGPVLTLVLIGLFLAALTEEILFRGFLSHGLTRRLGGRNAVLLGSGLFAIGHLPALTSAGVHGDGIAITLIVIFGLGVLLCRIRAATGSIWFATGVHTLWNFVTVGVVASSFTAEDIPAGFVLVKLAPVIAGIVLAIRLATNRDRGPVPPMPVPALVAPVAVPAASALPPPPRPDP